MSGRELPGLGVTTSFNPLGLDGAGTGYFIAWDEQGAQGLYRVAPDSVPEKVLAVGDPFASSTVQSISQEAGIAEDGDIGFGLWLEDGSQHVVWLSGEQTKTLPVRAASGSTRSVVKPACSSRRMPEEILSNVVDGRGQAAFS